MEEFELLIEHIREAKVLIGDIYLTNKKDRIILERFKHMLFNISNELQEISNRY